MSALSCETVREDLEALHYGDLGAPERAAVEGHLGGCGACRAALEAVRETAASLDGWSVPAPSEMDWARFGARLEARVSPLRAARMARSVGRAGIFRFGRIAAAFLIGGLAAIAGGFYVQNRSQAGKIDMLQRALADASWKNGDLAGATRLYVTTGEAQSDPTVRDRIATAVALEDDPRVAEWWALVRNEKGEQASRELVAEFLAAYPKHALADQAFLALQKKGMPKPPPLETAVLKPIPFVVRPLPEATAEQTAATHRARIAELREYARSADPKTGAWALYRAARIAEEQVGDGALAAELYAEAMRRVPSGAIHDAARERAGAK